MLVYHDLEILKVDYMSLNAASKVAENSGGYLRKILLEPYEFEFERNFDKDSLIFIRKIYENCPSIECLSLGFPPSKEHFTEFEKLLKVCQKLKSLLLIISNFDEDEEKILENGEELLKALAKSASTNLREIRFFNYFKFSLKDLEEFLEKWKGRSALSILTTDTTYQGNDYIKLINKYQNDGVIKAFRCESTANVENMDFKI